MRDSLTFVIQPDGESASVNLFLKALGHIHSLILDVDYAVTRDRATKRRWIISGLHASAPTVTIRTLLGETETVDAIANGIRIVTSGATAPPDFFTEEALEHLRKMERLFTGRDRAKAVVVSLDRQETATIRQDIEDQIAQILSGGYWNLGSIEGDLEAINLHGAAMFTVWDRLSKSPVRCFFPKDRPWTERVKALLEQRVIVRGRVRYFSNGRPRSITGIEDVFDASPDIRLAKGDFGSIPDPRAAHDPVAFLRDVRGTYNQG